MYPFYYRVMRKAQELSWERHSTMLRSKVRDDAMRRLFDALTTHDKGCDEKKCDCGADKFKSTHRRP